MMLIIPAGGSPFPDTKSLSVSRSVSSYARIAQSTLNYPTVGISQLCVSLWLKLTVAPTTGARLQIVADSQTVFSRVAISVVVNETYAIEFGLNFSGAWSMLLGSTPNAVSLNTWHHIKVYRDSAIPKAEIIVDGTSVGSTTSTGAVVAPISTGFMDIGTRPDVIGSIHHVTGLIDEVSLFEGAAIPTDAELRSGGKPADLTGLPGLKAWWRFEGDPNDSSGNGHTLTLVNSPTYSTDVP